MSDEPIAPHAQAIHHSALWLLLVLAGAVLAGEFLVMLVVSALPPMSDLAEALLDATLLCLGILPIFYFLVFKPFERNIADRTLAAKRMQLAAGVFSHAREGILITDTAGTIVDVNEAFTRITGYTRDEVHGQNPRLLQSGQHSAAFYAAMWQQLTETGHWTGELWNKRKNGESYVQLLSVSTVRDDGGALQQYVGLFTDITPMKEHARQLEHAAHYDALTSLPNRVLLADRLKQSMLQSRRRDKSVALAYLDLDGFKAVNDEFGHAVGDQLLVTVSQRMKVILREGDTLARVGGDEFVVVLADLAYAGECEPILKRLLLAASDPVTLGDKVMQVSASIGVTHYPKDDADADQLLRHADQAMYSAKRAGKNRFYLFDETQDRAEQTQRQTVDDIRRAVDCHELLLHYQPKVNMRSGEVVGAEALIRWQHPGRGLLMPVAFLPLITGQPIATEVGEWVISEALAQMAAWHALGLDIPVSVNIDGHQLQQRSFVRRLGGLLAAQSGVKPCCLELEVLETSALNDLVEVSRVMSECRELGVRFALDDFGTGYSSLTYLKHLPANVLKIDQSFVRDMLEDPNDLAIVQGVIGLATAFKRAVIAEGVETVAHGTMLLSLGCELAQGYGIARPMPADKMPEWVANWRPDAAWTTTV